MLDAHSGRFSRPVCKGIAKQYLENGLQNWTFNPVAYKPTIKTSGDDS